MAFSHLDASEVFPENGAGRAVLILDGVTIVLGVWVDMGFIGGFKVTGWVAGGTRVAGWIAVGLYVGNAEPEAKGVVAWSRGLLGSGSGLMSSGFRLILDLLLEMLATRGKPYSQIGGVKRYAYSFVTWKMSINWGRPVRSWLWEVLTERLNVRRED